MFPHLQSIKTVCNNPERHAIYQLGPEKNSALANVNKLCKIELPQKALSVSGSRFDFFPPKPV